MHLIDAEKSDCIVVAQHNPIRYLFNHFALLYLVKLHHSKPQLLDFVQDHPHIFLCRSPESFHFPILNHHMAFLLQTYAVFGPNDQA